MDGCMKQGDRVKLISMTEIDQGALKNHVEYYGKLHDWFKWPEVKLGEIGVVKSHPDNNGWCEVTFTHISIICSDEMVEIV